MPPEEEIRALLQSLAHDEWHQFMQEYLDTYDLSQEELSLTQEHSDAHLQYARALRTRLQNISKVKAMFSLKTYKRALNTALELAPDNLDAREEQIGFLVNAPGFAVKPSGFSFGPSFLPCNLSRAGL